MASETALVRLDDPYGAVNCLICCGEAEKREAELVRLREAIRVADQMHSAGGGVRLTLIQLDDESWPGWLAGRCPEGTGRPMGRAEAWRLETGVGWAETVQSAAIQRQWFR